MSLIAIYRDKKNHQIQALILSAAVFSALLLCACASVKPQGEQEEKIAEATRQIGEAYMRQGDYTSALRELINAKEQNPEDPIVYNDLGLCYMARDHMVDAIANFKKAITLKPSYAPARNNLGTAFLAVGEYDNAIEVFKEITQDVLYATPHFPLSNLGTAYFHKGDYENALHYYKEALKIQPDFVNALAGTGRTYLMMNQPRLAIRYLEQATKLAPKAADVYFYLAEAQLMIGSTEQARASYLTVIDLAPRESELAVKARQRLGLVQ
jgi:type IV pilus assembly protein PilF